MSEFPTALTPAILFEDQHLIVVSKPAGLLSQGEHKGDPNLVDWLRERFGRPYVGLIHRLDRNTSGAIVVAKRTKAAQRLTDSLQRDEMKRTYIAWINGVLKQPARWSHRLFKDVDKNVVRVVSESHPQGKTAILTVRPVQSTDWKGAPVTLVEFELETGRSHQIRVQSAHEGFPLLGDKKYANSRSSQASHTFERPALHSHRLSFPHPMSHQILEFEAPIPEDFRRIHPFK